MLETLTLDTESENQLRIRQADNDLQEELTQEYISSMRFEKAPIKTESAQLGQKIAKERRRVEKITSFCWDEENTSLKRVKLFFLKKLMNGLIKSGQDENHSSENIEGAKLFIEKSIKNGRSWEMASAVLEVFPEILPDVVNRILDNIPQEKSDEYSSFIKNPGAEKIVKIMVFRINRLLDNQTIKRSEKEEEILTTLKSKLEGYFPSESV